MRASRSISTLRKSRGWTLNCLENIVSIDLKMRRSWVAGGLSAMVLLVCIYHRNWLKADSVAGQSNSHCMNTTSAVVIGTLAIATERLPQGRLDLPYGASLVASNASGPPSWTVDAGSLPPGLRLDGRSGLILGTPTEAGKYMVTIALKADAAGQVTKQFSLAVAGKHLDEYGGAVSLSCSKNTGWFHTEKIGSGWWLCTPRGHAFFMAGIYVADTNGTPDDRGESYGAAVVKKYGDYGPAWAAATAKRLKSWGFNTLGPFASVYIKPMAADRSYPLDKQGLHSIPTKFPFLEIVRPEVYGMANVSNSGASYLTALTAVKNIGAGLSPLYTSYFPGDGEGDVFDPGIDEWLAADFKRNPQWTEIKKSPYFSYLLGVNCEDSDQTWGFGAGDAKVFPSVPVEKNSNNLAWLIATMSPLQTANSVKGFLYSNPEVLSKTEWKNQLIAKYKSIGALNLAWGSQYTTFGSSGVNHENEVIGKTDGAASTFFYHAAFPKVTPHSVQISIDGKLIGGDTGEGHLWGPRIDSGSSSVDYKTGNFKLALDTTAHHPIALIRGNGRGSITVKVPFNKTHSLEVGDRVEIGGTRNYNGSSLLVNSVGSSADLDYVLTVQSPSRSTEQELSGYFIYSPLPAGKNIAINYVQNGWGQGGTGLLDEDGSSRWMGGPKPSAAVFMSLQGLNSALTEDLNSFLYHFASHFFASCRNAIKSYGKSAGNPDLLYLGPDSLGTWSVPSRAPVLKAAGEYADAVVNIGEKSFTQPMMDFVAANYGDKPYYEGEFRTANRDSALFAFGEESVGGGFANQAARAQDFAQNVGGLHDRSARGSSPYIGYLWWRLTDDWAERLNWGLVTARDNAYDGCEARTSTGIDPFGFPTGGEVRDYGDVLDAVKQINFSWIDQN